MGLHAGGARVHKLHKRQEILIGKKEVCMKNFD